jgi:hypothetical protein
MFEFRTRFAEREEEKPERIQTALCKLHLKFPTRVFQIYFQCYVARVRRITVPVRGIFSSHVHPSPKFPYTAHTGISLYVPPVDTSVPIRIPPQSLSNNLVYLQDPHFAICVGCHVCAGSGRRIYPSNSVGEDRHTPLQELKCKECEGVGYSLRFMSLEQVFQTLAPYFMERFMANLPVFIQNAKMAIIQAVMES